MSRRVIDFVVFELVFLDFLMILNRQFTRNNLKLIGLSLNVLIFARGDCLLLRIGLCRRRKIAFLKIVEGGSSLLRKGMEGMLIASCLHNVESDFQNE